MKERCSDFKSTIIYSIYPKSFFDADQDGVGDLKGITSKLPYLLSLGVNAIALSAILETDNNGAVFAPTNFCRINPALGEDEDFDELIRTAHASDLKVYLTLPLTFTSIAHDWFEKSRSSAVSPYKEYYIWKPGKDSDGKNPPDAGKNFLGHSMWTYDLGCGEWYQNTFGDAYPTLNYENPRVRKDIIDVFRYWREKGVDGFIIDQATFEIKKIVLSDLKPMYKVNEELFDYGVPLYRILREILEKCEEDFPILLNAVRVTPGVYPYLISDDKQICDVISAEYLLEGTRIDEKRTFSAKIFIREYLALQESICKDSIALFLEDSYHSRLLSEFADSSDPYFTSAATFLATILMTSTATPILYQGEEIGMIDFRREKTVPEQTLALLHARSPFQWDNNPNAAFTTAIPHLPVNESYHRLNVISEAQDKDSILCFYQKIIALRKASTALTFGSFRDFTQGNVLTFIRESETERLLVIANASPKPINYKVPLSFNDSTAYCELCNYPIYSKALHSTMGLRPYEIRIFRLKSKLLQLN